MKAKFALLAVSATMAVAGSASAQAQAKEQFFPVLSYRTGAYAPNGIPFANGYMDYLKLVNARDGGTGDNGEIAVATGKLAERIAVACRAARNVDCLDQFVVVTRGRQQPGEKIFRGHAPPLSLR